MNQFHFDTLSTRGNDAIRSQLMSTLGVQMKPSSSSSSLEKSALDTTKDIPRRFQSKNYKWEQGFSARRRNSLLSSDEKNKLSLSDKKNFQWGTVAPRRPSFEIEVLEVSLEEMAIE